MVKLSQLKDEVMLLVFSGWVDMEKVRHDHDAGYTAVNQNEI